MLVRESFNQIAETSVLESGGTDIVDWYCFRQCAAWRGHSFNNSWYGGVGDVRVVSVLRRDAPEGVKCVGRLAVGSLIHTGESNALESPKSGEAEPL